MHYKEHAVLVHVYKEAPVKEAICQMGNSAHGVARIGHTRTLRFGFRHQRDIPLLKDRPAELR